MSKKIQSLLIEHLTKHGNIELLLPDGLTVMIGVDQESHDGRRVKVDGYAWVTATRKDRSLVEIDSYNLGIRFEDDASKVLLEDSFLDDRGMPCRRVDVC